VEPWDTISVDFIVKLPESHGYDTIMNVIDSVTKRMHFIPMHTTITAKDATHLYLREVWEHHGMLRVVLLDRGSQFTARFMHELYKLLRIKLATLTAYHPQTNS
jgi:transposase InsO family protein